MALLGGRSKAKKPLTAWPVFVVLMTLAVAFGLKIVEGLRGPEVPRSQVPAVAYDDIVQPENDVASPSAVLPLEGNVGDEMIAPSPTDPTEPSSQLEPSTQPSIPPLATPASELNLAVPFTSQAPTGNWDVIHEDTCEEASFMMVAEYYNGTAAGKMDPGYVDPILYDMVDQQTALGMGYSISAAQSEEFIEIYYNLNATVVDDPTVAQIKQLISEGKPIIVPVAGRELDNPFFTGEGPLYHMLVIRGYTEDTFITNDPGTRNGDNYIYSLDTIMSAMGDWNDGDPYSGAKRIIYIDP